MTDTNTATSAATDLLGASLPLPEPPTPAYFINPGSAGYVDQTGQLRATLSTEQLATARADWLDAFDRQAKDARFSGGDLSKYGPEQRAAWAAKFDAAALSDNLAPMEPPTAEMVQARQEYMLPSNPTPADYKPSYGDFAKDKTTEHLGQFNTEMTQWAAAVGFAPEIGTAVIERLVEVAPRLAGMSPEQRAEWVDQQDQIMLQRVGSPQALAELKEQAKKALGIAKGNKFSEAAAKAEALNDPWLLTTLANHARAVAGFSAKYGRK